MEKEISLQIKEAAQSLKDAQEDYSFAFHKIEKSKEIPLGGKLFLSGLLAFIYVPKQLTEVIRIARLIEASKRYPQPETQSE